MAATNDYSGWFPWKRPGPANYLENDRSNPNGLTPPAQVNIPPGTPEPQDNFAAMRKLLMSIRK